MICFSSDFMWFYYLAIYSRVCPLNAFMPHSALFSLLTALQTSVSQKDRVNPLGKAPRLEGGLQEVSSPASCSRLGHHWIRARLCPGGCWKLPGTETPHPLWLLVPRLLWPSRRNFFMSRQNLIRADLVFVSILMKMSDRFRSGCDSCWFALKMPSA